MPARRPAGSTEQPGAPSRKPAGHGNGKGNGNGNGHGNGHGAHAVVAPPAPDVPRPLVELASDWLALTAALRHCAELPDPVPLRSRAAELRESFERAARDRGVAEPEIQAAVFSLTAFLDEMVRRAKGRARDEWISSPLQLEWFHTSRAGVEFYDRLDELRRERAKRIEALEVATACVALGFEGKLATAREKRVALLGDLLADVAAVRGGGETPLAPHVIGRDRPTGTVVPELPRWLSVVAFAIATLMLWVAVSQLGQLASWRAVQEIQRPVTGSR